MRPFINNPFKERVEFLGKEIHTYHQNGYDWFYSTYMSCCYEKLYNYWDRIGDRLSVSFDTRLNTWEIGFHSVMNVLSKEDRFLKNEHFNYLKFYWENDFKEFNKIRKDIVHYCQSETHYKYEMTTQTGEEEKVIELWEWKSSLPEYFKEQLHKCRVGYWNMVMLEQTLE